jgi:ATP-dependent exoDNAse (exonuclease V) beta subunit
MRAPTSEYACIEALKASAGAGKTYQLTVRFLSLLKQMAPSAQCLRQIVAITFTNRAAAEMKGRIILALKKIALPSEEGKALVAATGLTPREAVTWLDVMLAHFDDFHVRTIDSLIYTLVRGFAIEMGLQPELDVDFDREIILDRCFDRLLASVPWDRRDDPRHELFRDLLETYLTIEQTGGMQTERGIRRRLKELFSTIETLDASGPRPDVTSARKRLEEIGGQLAALIHQCGIEECLKKGVCKLEYLEDPLDHLTKAMFSKDSIADLMKAGSTVDHRVPRQLDELYQTLKTARETYLRTRSSARLYAYVRTLRELRAEIRGLAQREGKIIGGDWLSMARTHFSTTDATASFAFLKLGGMIHHFLIDEFQDTSISQWRTLMPLVEEALSRGGSLFYVGDVKQAIYGWRGGDWRLFSDVVSRDFFSDSNEARTIRTLNTNYRSVPSIVRFNNAMYGLLTDSGFVQRLANIMLPQSADAAAAAELAALISGNFQDVHQEVAPGLHDDDMGDDAITIVPLTAPLDHVRQQVKESLVSQIRAVWRRQQTGIAVLVRRNQDARDAALWLMAEGIPVVTENSLRLKNSPLIKGLVAFLRFLEYPLDDMAFWGALASPLFRGHHKICPENFEEFLREGHWRTPLYKTFGLRFTELSDEFVRPLLARAGFLTPYDLTRDVIGQFELLDRYPRYAVFLYRFLELLFQAETRGYRSLSLFLRFWDEGGADEQVGLPDDVRAIRILTIHKAKGLEFPVVFIPFTHWRIQPPTTAATAEGEIVSLIKPLCRELEIQRLHLMMHAILEQLNLLYVATTRARERLYLYVTRVSAGERVDTGYLSAWLHEMLTETRHVPYESKKS